MNILSKYSQKRYQWFMWIVFLLCCMLPSRLVFAQDLEYAEVKIVIEQKLSFEWQAFDARMVINNGLTDSTLENIRIDLLFTDKNNQPVIVNQDANGDGAKFFYRINSLSGINGVEGNGQINAKSSAEIHWLVIPAYGATESENTLYYVGAKVTYTLNGQEKTVDVTPDYVVVKPQLLLALDYSMPKNVYEDAPFKPNEEGPIINNILVAKDTRYSLNELLPENYYFKAKKPYIVKFISRALNAILCPGETNFDQRTKSCKVGLSPDYSFKSDIFIPSKSGVLHDEKTFVGGVYLLAYQSEMVKVILIPLDMDNSLTNTMSVIKDTRYSLQELLPKNYYFDANKSYLIKFSGDSIANYNCPGQTNFDPKLKVCKLGLSRDYSFASEIFRPFKSGFLQRDIAFTGGLYTSVLKTGTIKVFVIQL